MLNTLAEKVDPGHTAVLVVDVQNDFCHEQSPYTARRQNMPGVQEAVGRMEAFIDEARRAGALVVFVQNVSKPGQQSEAAQEHMLRNAPGADPNRGICEEGTWGAEFYVVSPLEGDMIAQKSSYSAFINSNFEAELRARGIRTLIMAGVSTNVCVESTLRHGFMLGFYVVLAEDCCGYYKANLHEATLENVRDRFGTVATSGEIVSAWAAVPAI